ncbi:sigma 54-interacting transcriptional regulator [Thermodesulfatator indicus]
MQKNLLKIRKREIEALRGLNRSFSIEKPIFVYIYTALNILKEYMLYEDVALWLKESKHLKLIYASGDNIEKFESLQIKLGEGLIGRIAQLGYPETIVNLEEIKEFKNLLRRQNLKDLMFFIVPLINENKDTIGVLTASHKKNDEMPTGWHIDFLEVAASILGHHIELYESFRKEKDKLKNTIKNMEDIIYSGSFAFAKSICPKLEKIANTDINILLTGESGTGKSSLAKHIHDISYRKNKPFVVINCAAIPKDLLESELFGYEKGAFTGATSTKKGKLELASGGTVFLDEIGDLPLELQPKLLQAIQEKRIERIGGVRSISIDVRFISATNQDLISMVQKKLFREDLFYRISGIEIRLPPLRERKSEFESILKSIMLKLSGRYNKQIYISKKAFSLLKKYNWPGNIRELENVLELAFVLDDDNILDIDDLPFKLIKQSKELSSYLEKYIKNYIQELNELFYENKKISSELIDYIYSLNSLQSFEDLKLFLKRCYTLDQDGILNLSDIDTKVYQPIYQKTSETNQEKKSTKKQVPSKKLSTKIEEIEKEEIIKALKKHRWILTRAAKELGYTRRQLEYRIKKYNINP